MDRSRPWTHLAHGHTLRVDTPCALRTLRVDTPCALQGAHNQTFRAPAIGGARMTTPCGRAWPHLAHSGSRRFAESGRVGDRTGVLRCTPSPTPRARARAHGHTLRMATPCAWTHPAHYKAPITRHFALRLSPGRPWPHLAHGHTLRTPAHGHALRTGWAGGPPVGRSPMIGSAGRLLRGSRGSG